MRLLKLAEESISPRDPANRREEMEVAMQQVSPTPPVTWPHREAGGQ